MGPYAPILVWAHKGPEFFLDQHESIELERIQSWNKTKRSILTKTTKIMLSDAKKKIGEEKTPPGVSKLTS